MRNCKENVQLRVRNSQTAAARALALALAHGSARLGSSTRHAAPHDAHDAHAVARVAHHAVLRDVRLSFAFGTNVSGTRAARPCTRSMFPYHMESCECSGRGWLHRPSCTCSSDDGRWRGEGARDAPLQGDRSRHDKQVASVGQRSLSSSSSVCLSLSLSLPLSMNSRVRPSD